jgi:hypothetical protein
MLKWKRKLKEGREVEDGREVEMEESAKGSCQKGASGTGNCKWKGNSE